MAGQGKNGILVRAQEDEVEGEEADSEVEDEEGGTDAEVENEEESDDTTEDEDDKKNVHKDAETILLFTKPSSVGQFEGGGVELPAGKV